MPHDSIVYLMYHELEVAGRSLCQNVPGYVRYIVREPDFREQMTWLQSAGMRGVSVSDALNNKAANGIVLTFDDGCETDLTVAAPILQKEKFAATFYITVGYLGRPGYLVPRQVRGLIDAGFEVGCHSMTHPYLSDLADQELHREIVEAKTQLEDIIGRPVHHFSCPGGRWSPNVAAVARLAGYRSITTSRIAVNRPTSDPFRLARIAVMRGTTPKGFQNLCRGHGLWQRKVRSALQTTSHQILGNAIYDRLRSLLLQPKV
jgi:peptidoglycan/xylan/chitin deacetylase (PgdA/CDA1 family)